MLIWSRPFTAEGFKFIYCAAPPKPTLTAAGGGKINQAWWVVIVGRAANQR